MKKYLRKGDKRQKAIEKNTDDMFYFQHQDVRDVDAFKTGIRENNLGADLLGVPFRFNLQNNRNAAEYVLKNSELIENAADEFDVSSDLVKAVIYTELSRGWYDILNLRGSPTILPGNIKKGWEMLIPGSSVDRKSDNIRLTANLLA